MNKLSKLGIVGALGILVTIVFWPAGFGRHPKPAKTRAEVVHEKSSPKLQIHSHHDVFMEKPESDSDFSQSVFRVLKRLFGKKNSTWNGQDLLNETLSYTERCRLAWQMARSGHPDDFALLTDYLSSLNTNLSIKAVMVEALGQSTNPQSRDWLISALDCGESRIIRAALRGLATQEDPRNAKLFIDLISAQDASPDVRAEAAVALGKLPTAESGRYLMQAWEQSSAEDTTLREIILEGLSHRNLSETAELFGQIMKDSSDPEVRRAVVQAASQALGETGPFLRDSLKDADDEVRAEAAWGLALQPDGHCAGALMDQLKGEQDDSVKAQLYAALAVQSDLDVPAVLELAQAEPDDSVRLAACCAVAERYDELSSEDQKQADSTLSRELQQLAMNGESLDVRLRAVTGLKHMQTTSSKKALQEIGSSGTDSRVIRASK